MMASHKLFQIRLLSLLVILFYVLKINAQVNVIQDIDYRENDQYNNNKDLLDIYMPEGAKKVPVLVYFHGGALLKGTKKAGNEIGRKLAASGIGFISANYRLSPEFKHPDHVNDAAAATLWVLRNIADYGGDPSKVYVSGHSSGGYLAALLAVAPTFLKSNDVLPKIKGGILISAFLYVEETAKDRIAINPIYKSIWGEDPLAWEKASVSSFLSPNKDNILLIYADGDAPWRKAQNQRFAKTLSDFGNQSIILEKVPNRDHGTLITKILSPDDRIVNLIKSFVLENKK